MFLLDPGLDEISNASAFKAAITRWDVGCDPDQSRVTAGNTYKFSLTAVHC
jgi:hypothetical protein